MDTLVIANDLGLLLMDPGRLPESDAAFREPMRGAEAALPPGHRFTAVFRRNRGRVLVRQGALTRRPRPSCSRAHRELLAAAGDEHRDTQAAMRRLVELYDAWGKPAQSAGWKKRLPAA